MKKLIAVFSLLLLGAGCLPVANKVVEGRWQLAFDLPSGWVMVKPYDVDSKHVLDYGVERNDSSVVVQSRDQKLCYTTGTSCEDVNAVTPTEDDVRILVTKLDPRRVLPDENVEDLGKSFFRIKLCEEDEDCRAGGAGNYEYFLTTEGGNYKFTYYGDTEKADKVIRSAKIVTRFTDGAQVEVETN